MLLVAQTRSIRVMPFLPEHLTFTLAHMLSSNAEKLALWTRALENLIAKVNSPLQITP